ncbi:phage tail protein [Citrobacter freundii]|uniref:phage tail protein n=4 Tax=Citrobacter freundii TaxID=546 RepID=UPI00224936FA|nr:phage tail protein [Citrobacter freundii]UZQ87773.1 phage tail protein [Citrobacter freundii]UZQ94111.1 phage tail protein [Citrobacter freundii]UZQ98617.1 phage tail protein [Citrobacter freundii]
MADYYSIITNRGKELEAEALASGRLIVLTHFVVGDSNGKQVKPDPSQIRLINETYRGDIAELVVSPEQSTQLMAKIVLPTGVGGFTVREVGLMTDAGELYAVANCPSIDKPVGGVSVNMQFRLAVSDTSNITLNVATGDGLFLRIDQNLKEIKVRGAEAQKTSRESIGVLDGTTQQRGLVQLNSAVNSTSETQAATPAAVKIVMDNANARLAKDRNGADIPNVALFLQNLGLGKTDTPEFGGLKAPSITLRDGKISLTSSTDGTTLVFTVSGEPVAEIKAGSFFHKKIISAGEILQSPKYIFRDGDIIFYSGPNNLVMQVDGKDVATLTPENFYHVKQVAAAESLSAPKVILRPGDVNLVSGKNNLVIQVGGNDVATLTPENFYHVKQVAAAESLKAPKVILRDGDVNLISGANNLVIQVGGNDVATLTPENFYHVKQVAAAESLKAPKVILRDGDVNLISGANNLVIQVGGNDIASLTPGNNFFKGKLTAENSLQVGSTCILATDGNLTGSKWGGWLDAFMKDGMSTDGNGLWWDAFSSQLQFRVGDWNIPDVAGGAGTSVTFPKAFKNGCLMVIPIPGDGGSSEQIGSQSYSASGAVLQKGASDKNPRSGKYLAIGY